MNKKDKDLKAMLTSFLEKKIKHITDNMGTCECTDCMNHASGTYLSGLNEALDAVKRY